MFNFIKKQFIDVIQWPNPDDSLLMWRFPIADEEIQNGASRAASRRTPGICWLR